MEKVEQENWTKVSVNQSELKKLQKEMEEGHRPGLGDPLQVAYEFLEYELNLKGERSQPIQTLGEGKKVVTFSLDNEKVIELRTIQILTSEKSRRGLWVVEAYRYIK